MFTGVLKKWILNTNTHTHTLNDIKPEFAWGTIIAAERLKQQDEHLNLSQRVNKTASNVFNVLTNDCIYNEKSRNTISEHPPLSRSLSESWVGLCAQETTSHFPSFHVWNFSCTRYASNNLYSLGWIHKWRMGYKFSTWCHWSGTC